MNLNFSFIVAFIALICVSSGLACFSTFKNAQNITFVQEDCMKSAGFTTAPSTEELAVEDFNDKCLSKCILNGLQMIDTEGQIDKDVLIDFMESNAPDAYLMKLSELASACSESSGSDKISGGSKTGKSLEECKPMKRFYSCFLSETSKLC